MPAQTYHFHEGSFGLPAALKDRTVHMFALETEGPSEFTLVVTRASGIEEPTVEDFGHRLLTELRKGLAKFELKSTAVRSISGQPALDLHYAWRSDGQLLHQRQVVVLTHSLDEGKRNALQFIGTSPKALTQEWAEAFESMLASVQLRPEITLAAAVAPVADPAEVDAERLS